ncbi:UvrD-helicase-domain-containing protein [Heliocybe sulcata]|uniref:DNA 3'-5' helicase n=1 Tax=Heliocybe sulcata TaxID=5364 RepID=A0A5C3MS45_9AGAM|nr:UvrD-helicase-domain-containing protein [Heliocybe sulcata]
MADEYLRCLNTEQLRAVRHPHHVPLQILAGPGSGKTKVLTSRIAYLILHEHIQPQSICAVTFTNKAAREMKERLTKLIGKAKVEEVKTGTFHALCALFLRRYPNRVGVKSNFTVCDSDESKTILKRLLNPYKGYLDERHLSLEVRTVMSVISKAKSKGQTPHDLATSSNDIDHVIGELFESYERFLRENNSLDFDDLLVYGVRLFSQQQVSNWCQHVLVDEFQDTNTLQYDLMRHIASSSRCVTIVGDPDQSIYGWRSAEVANLARMKLDFPATVQIYLEQNYRSTASILRASMAIVSQDKTRIPKTLHTSHSNGCTPVLQCFPSEQEESACIAREIKRLSAASGGLLGWEDFVILLRMNSLSRSLESALRKEGIPCRVLKGQKFFEPYLQVVDNPDFVPAFERVINVPGRGIGDKTLGEILRAAHAKHISPLAFIERIYDGRVPDTKPPVKRKIASFVKAVRELRTAARQGTMPADIIRALLGLVEYEEHLKRTQPDADTRWENVMELINFASEVQTDLNDYQYALQDLTEDVEAGGDNERDQDWDDMPAETEAVELDEEGFVEVKPATPGIAAAQEDRASEASTPLRLFLQASMLSGDSGEGGEEGEREKVTISTCHSAKGLEWPVVFVPAVEEGTFPFALSEDTNEERRLLYVACTRAQNLLYLSHCTKRLVAGKQMGRKLSGFVCAVIEDSPDIFAENMPEFDRAALEQMAAILAREIPSEEVVARKLAEFYRTDHYHQFTDTSSKAMSTTFVAADAVYRADAGKSVEQRQLTDKLPSRGLGVMPLPTVTQKYQTHALLQNEGQQVKLAPTAFSAPQYLLGDSSNHHRPSKFAHYPGLSNQRPSLHRVSESRSKQPPRCPPMATPATVHPNDVESSLKYPQCTLLPSSEQGSSSPGAATPPVVAARPVKRRLGMGRIATGYANKKFKPPQ